MSRIEETKIPGYAERTLAFRMILELAAASAEELASFYNREAQRYSENTSYPGAKLAATAVSHLFKANTTVRILDLGAGTGKTGMELQGLGFTDIDANEPATKMMEITRMTGAYKNFYPNFVGADHPPMDIADETYDVITAAGVFVPGHVGADGLPEVLRLLKIGGYAVITMASSDFERTYGYNLEAVLSRLSADAKITIKREVIAEYLSPDAPGTLLTLQKLK